MLFIKQPNRLKNATDSTDEKSVKSVESVAFFFEAYGQRMMPCAHKHPPQAGMGLPIQSSWFDLK